jgi:hypothetical protein
MLGLELLSAMANVNMRVAGCKQRLTDVVVMETTARLVEVAAIEGVNLESERVNGGPSPLLRNS